MSQGSQGTVKVCFSLSDCVSGIERATGEHVTMNNEVYWTEIDERYIQIVLVADKIYGTGKPRFQPVMFQHERKHGCCEL